jgi:kynurenine 3-monooxygenase
MDFSQSFIPHAYIELHMPPASDGSFAIDANHLHIWPRHSFMLIGLPNQVRSQVRTMEMLPLTGWHIVTTGFFIHSDTVCAFLGN